MAVYNLILDFTLAYSVTWILCVFHGFLVHDANFYTEFATLKIINEINSIFSKNAKITILVKLHL